MRAEKHHPSKPHEKPIDKEIRREWKHLVKFKDENRLLFAAFVLLVAALVVINTVFVIRYNDSRPVTSWRGTAVGVDTILPTQLQAATPAYTAKIAGVATNSREDKAFPIGPDETMLIFTFTITNNSGKEQDLYPTKHLYVRDEEGRIAGPHASMYITNAFPAGKIDPGQTVTGELSFAVHKSAVHPHFYIDPGWDSQAPVVYDLSK